MDVISRVLKNRSSFKEVNSYLPQCRRIYFDHNSTKYAPNQAHAQKAEDQGYLNDWNVDMHSSYCTQIAYK